MSFKNTLQELYQKQKLPLPKYKTVRLGGEEHKPIFISTITLYDGQIIEGTSENTKKTAELNVAKKVLELVNPPKIIEKRSFNLKRKICLFVDIENKPIIEDLLDFIEDLSKIHIHAFASEDHPSLIKLKELKQTRKKDFESIEIIEVPTTRKDGADIGLMLFVGGFLFKKMYKDYIIITNDHYGDALVDCVRGINKMYDWGPSNPRIHCCRTLERIIEKLEEYEFY